MNSSTKQKQSYRCGKQTYGYQGVRQGDINWKTGVDIYTVLQIKQTINKDLQYSTGDSTQYPEMAYVGKEPKVEQTRVRITDSLHYPAEVNTKL